MTFYKPNYIPRNFCCRRDFPSDEFSKYNDGKKYLPPNSISSRNHSFLRRSPLVDSLPGSVRRWLGLRSHGFRGLRRHLSLILVPAVDGLGLVHVVDFFSLLLLVLLVDLLLLFDGEVAVGGRIPTTLVGLHVPEVDVAFVRLGLVPEIVENWN